MAAARQPQPDTALKAWNATRGVALVDQGRLARSWGARLWGLLGTRALLPGDGLLIEPCSSIHSFGMRYSFDALFLDRGGRVVAAIDSMPANRMHPGARSAVAVLELPAGTIRATGTQLGDEIEWEEEQSPSPPPLRPGSGRGLPKGRGGRLLWMLCDHVLPSALFTAALLAQAPTLAEIARGLGPAAGLDGGPQAVLFTQRVLATAFIGLVGALFALRRARIGPRAGLIPSLVALAGTTVLALQVLAPVVEPSPLLAAPGAVLLIAGMTWSLVSLACLGRSFGVFPEARSLVTRGPYRYIRHPLYLGEIVAALGAILPAFSLYTVALFGAFVGFQYWRAINEEWALSAVFAEYGDYAERTWRILPGIH